MRHYLLVDRLLKDLGFSSNEGDRLNFALEAHRLALDSILAGGEYFYHLRRKTACFRCVYSAKN